MTADESIDFLGCPKKGVTVSIKLDGGSGGGKKDPETDKYDCVNNKCVVTSGGPYDNDTCDGKCTKSETPPPDKDQNDIGVVCEVKQTAKPMRNAVSVELIGKISDTKGCKNFKWYFFDETYAGNNVRMISFVDNDDKKSTIEINSKLKAVCETDSKITGIAYCKASIKKDQGDGTDPIDSTINVTTSGG
jgi:hypothetical protein